MPCMQAMVKTLLTAAAAEIFQGNAGIFQAKPNDFPYILNSPCTGLVLSLLTETEEIFQGNAGIFQAIPNDFP